MGKSIQNIVVICGPTASGKTGIALQLAKELKKANILSVDSRQLYKGLDIVTGKDTPEKLPKGIAIFGHNIFEPDKRSNVGEFVRYSHKVIKDSLLSKTPLIIVGGTGLYLKAITQNLSNVGIPPNNKLRKTLEKYNLNQLQELLKKENFSKYQELNRSDLMNPRRLIRYIEISKSKIKSPKPEDTKDYPTYHWIGILPDKETLKANIKNRVINRLKAGAIDEVAKLQENYPNRSLPIYSSLGVSQLIDFKENKLTQEELIEVWSNAEIDYSKRQIVWFKKQPGIFWYDKSTDRDSLVSKLHKIYQSNA